MNLRFLSLSDLILVPVCLVLLHFILRYRASRADEAIRRLYFRAFYFKVFFVFAFTFVTEFYFGGGDTGLYYQGVQDLRAAMFANPANLWTILTSSSLANDSTLTPYFLYDNYSYDITYYYMLSASNFYVPKLALLPSLLFFNSYLCICLCFSFFALGGALRLFKTFYHFYPKARREIALATVFLPSVAFWSSGVLKDTICFGAVGFAVYGLFNIFVRRKNYVSSLIWIIVSGVLLYIIKTYIFLVLLMALCIWVFSETNRKITDRKLRLLIATFTLLVGLGLSFLLLSYFTSGQTVRQYQLENIVSSAENQRNKFASIESASQGGGSYYQIDASNPVLLVINSIVASFFRPFPWEARSAVAILSALEALGVTLLTLSLVFRRNTRSVALIFSEPTILFCFVFAIVFAIGVGASTANFGALSRYKIPCMPFYLLTITLLFHKQQLAYPRWFNKLLGTIKF